MPTSIYSIISKCSKGKYSVLRLLGLGWAQTKRHPVPALVKCKSGWRDTCAHKRPVLSADLRYCCCVNQAGAGTGPELSQEGQVSQGGSHCSTCPISWSPVLFYHPPILATCLYLFTATHPPQPGVGSFPEPIRSRCFPYHSSDLCCDQVTGHRFHAPFTLKGVQVGG